MFEKKEYIVYCDESDRKGKKFSYFYGALIIEKNDKEFIEKLLYGKILDDRGLNYTTEIKWYKISDSNWKLKILENFLDALFDLIEQKKIKIRISFCQYQVFFQKSELFGFFV